MPLTRQALTGGFTTFERILPGPDRMYPDTDSPPTGITPERVEAARGRLRQPPWARIERWRSQRVPEETAHYLIRRGGADIVDAVVARTGADALVAAIEIGQRTKALSRAGIPVSRLGTEEWVQVFDLYTDGHVPREAISAVAGKMAADKLDAKAACAALGIALQGRESWARQVGDLTMEGYRGEKSEGVDKALRFLSGKAVQLLKGKAPAKEVAELVRTTLKERAAR